MITLVNVMYGMRSTEIEELMSWEVASWNIWKRRRLWKTQKLYFIPITVSGNKRINSCWLRTCVIKGHTQIEGDLAHSLIEHQVNWQLKSGPIYMPEGFISAIKVARKKWNSFSFNKLSFTDFYYIKDLASSMGPVNHTGMKISEIKIRNFCRDSPVSVFYKTSYAQTTFEEIKL